MSASPTQPTQSAKRPLEEASSPSRAGDQPDAKRPALDKNKHDDDVEVPEAPTDVPAEDHDDKVNGAHKSEDDDDTTLDHASDTKAAAAATVAASASNAVTSAAAHDETSWIHIRAVISSPEAATVIGKGGENVSNIRKLSNAKCTVSDYQKGAVERILTVSGIVDAVAKAFGLIIRTLNNEPLNESSTASSKTYPLRLLIPHILIGSIIGKGGARIREIQEASGARLNASDSCLPMSSERSLVVMGVADAVHIATYYVGSTLLEQLNDRFGGPAASAYATRSGAPAGSIPGAQPMGGAIPGGPITQQIYIPNDMVGAIIGKGGQKINEIRQMSNSVIKINEPQDNSNERLVTITGTEECNRMALYMLYSRLGEVQNRPSKN
ncbi:hnRNP protein E2 [Fusarium fujikuroi]|nr:hnRNP protein E2 [Fusarium fujikuroi]